VSLVKNTKDPIIEKRGETPGESVRPVVHRAFYFLAFFAELGKKSYILVNVHKGSSY
jgi:hypothetical protein